VPAQSFVPSVANTLIPQLKLEDFGGVIRYMAQHVVGSLLFAEAPVALFVIPLAATTLGRRKGPKRV
jgi:hypothetical protein